MAYTVRKRIKRAIWRYLLSKAYRDLLEEEFGRRVIKSVAKHIGPFSDGAKYADLAVSSPSSESGTILGEVVHALKAAAQPRHTLLLAGDRKSARACYSQVTVIPPERVLTAGLHEDMDFFWDYEKAPSGIPEVDVIVSQAMLEHLVDPFRHVCDCHSLLKKGGTMILHTVMPGFQYHRYPVDCFRFYPDWFEEVASRLGAKVIARYLSQQGHIVFCISRSEAS